MKKNGYSKVNLTFILQGMSFILILISGCTYKKEPSAKFVISSLLKESVGLVTVDDKTLYAQSQIRDLYQYSRNDPIWIYYIADAPKFQELTQIIEGIAKDGLNPLDYHLDDINDYYDSYLSSSPKVRLSSEFAKLDLLLSDAFLTLAFHLQNGKVGLTNPGDTLGCFFQEMSLSDYLWDAIQRDRLSDALSMLDPPYLEFDKLKQNIRKGASLGKEQQEKIWLSMERWRWLPKGEYPMFIIVNIPRFVLQLYEGDSIVTSLKTMVGTNEDPTPILNCEISHLVIRPRWNIPETILKKEVLARILFDTSYLQRNHYVIVQNWLDDDSTFIDPGLVRWDTMSLENFPYKLVQKAGIWNPMGMVKFMFPNEHLVYLHGTPSSHLFSRDIRAFSHGCIRVEKEKVLAVLLTKNDSLMYPGLYFDENEKVNLLSPVPIFINYWTAWPEAAGVSFYEDIYGLDSILLAEMKKSPTIF